MRVAFVVQRCGREVVGGAELHCLQVAQHMGRHWETEILTTCALDYMRWENFYPPGAEEVPGTTIRRFPVDQPRDVQQFNRLSGEMRARARFASALEQERWMRAQGPMSTPLLQFLEANKETYDAFIFFGYLYATTYFGLPIVQSRALLAPLAHDEWEISLPMWDRLFALPQAIIFNTATEQQFLRRRFPRLNLSGPTVGVGIEAPEAVDAAKFRAKYQIDGPFLLYVGRIDAAKGCAELFDFFRRGKADNLLKHKLVLIGREVLPVPFHDEIVHLGFLSDEEKWAALAACDWLMMPSPNESLSMALLEGWAAGRPAIVNGLCDVLVNHCRTANAGLWYKSYEEWIAALRITPPALQDALGARGREYVRRQYSWERVEDDYLQCLASLSFPSPS
jgi:glycosyltransferase involved in cell wall biosynthesis